LFRNIADSIIVMIMRPKYKNSQKLLTVVVSLTVTSVNKTDGL